MGAIGGIDNVGKVPSDNSHGKQQRSKAVFDIELYKNKTEPRQGPSATRKGWAKKKTVVSAISC